MYTYELSIAQIYITTILKNILNETESTYIDNYPILIGESEAAIWSLNNGKSHGIDDIAGELLKSGGENVISVITYLCNEI